MDRDVRGEMGSGGGCQGMPEIGVETAVKRIK